VGVRHPRMGPDLGFRLARRAGFEPATGCLEGTDRLTRTVLDVGCQPVL